ncbi:hypothetical protein JCM8547_008237 [Rhodosporidiobolus lusitaniae]
MLIDKTGRRTAQGARKIMLKYPLLIVEVKRHNLAAAGRWIQTPPVWQQPLASQRNPNVKKLLPQLLMYGRHWSSRVYLTDYTTTFSFFFDQREIDNPRLPISVAVRQCVAKYSGDSVCDYGAKTAMAFDVFDALRLTWDGRLEGTSSVSFVRGHD